VETYDVGDKPEVQVTFRDTADVLTNPGALSGLIRYPDGTEAALSAPTNNSTGIYTWAIPTLTQQGVHVVRAKGTSGLVAATEVSFKVRATAFTAP
jgi:hypothetical protein